MENILAANLKIEKGSETQLAVSLGSFLFLLSSGKSSSLCRKLRFVAGLGKTRGILCALEC